MEFLHNNKQTKGSIERIIKESKNVYLAVAFWGQGSSDIVRKSKDKEIKIICNLESDVEPAKIFLLRQKIAFLPINNDEELCLFEIYCSMKLGTWFNDFETH